MESLKQCNQFKLKKLPAFVFNLKTSSIKTFLDIYKTKKNIQTVFSQIKTFDHNRFGWL